MIQKLKSILTWQRLESGPDPAISAYFITSPSSISSPYSITSPHPPPSDHLICKTALAWSSLIWFSWGPYPLVRQLESGSHEVHICSWDSWSLVVMRFISTPETAGVWIMISSSLPCVVTPFPILAFTLLASARWLMHWHWQAVIMTNPSSKSGKSLPQTAMLTFI